MLYTSLNHIVRSVLNQKGYSIHWYFQYLKYGTDCLRELHFDTMYCVQTVKLPVDEFGRVPLPCDYVDKTKVGLIVGQLVKPLVQHEGINRLSNLDDNGNVIAYGTTDPNAIDELTSPWANSAIWFNDNGEYIGRDFGHKNSNNSDGYKILRERGELQLSEGIGAEFIILEYISDGTGLTDAATRVHPYAQKCIESYIFWKGSANRDNPLSPEAEEFNRKHRVLRARLAGWTVNDVKRALNRNKQATPK